jgi:hypothetical protein
MPEMPELTHVFTDTRASWFAVLKHTVDLDSPADSGLVLLYDINGETDTQPCYGYGDKFKL